MTDIDLQALKNVNCLLCGDQRSDPKTSGIISLYGENAFSKSVLFDSGNLYVTPAPGTLTVGYLILAPRQHFPNFSCLSLSAWSACHQLLLAVSEIGKKHSLSPYIYFEHGTGLEGEKGASCVDHAHLHLIPCDDPSEIRNSLKDNYDEIKLNKMEDIVLYKNKFPYVLLAYGNNCYLYITIEIDSQFVRKILANYYGISNLWNWTLYPMHENYWATASLFKGLTTMHKTM